jgi:hypothetical protein
MLARRGAVAAELADLSGMLFNRNTGFFPHQEDPLGWTSRQVSLLAASCGLRLRSVEPLTPPAIPHRRGAPARIFAPYRVACIMEGSQAQCLSFISKAQEANPYVNVSALHVSTPSAGRADRVIQLTLEWPRWAEPESLDRLRAIERRLQAEADPIGLSPS